MPVRTYSEQLKDPKWQKKRLEIFNRDKWKCQYCGDNEKTLNIHHLSYIPNREPYNYPNSYLITLCEDCHTKEKGKNETIKELSEVFSFSFSNEQLKEISEAIQTHVGTGDNYLSLLISKAIIESISLISSIYSDIILDKQFHPSYFQNIKREIIKNKVK